MQTTDFEYWIIKIRRIFKIGLDGFLKFATLNLSIIVNL